MTTEMNVEEQQQLVGEFLQGLAQSFGIKADAENVFSGNQYDNENMPKSGRTKLKNMQLMKHCVVHQS